MRALGKAIFPVIETPTGDAEISPDIQALNLLSDREGGLERLSREITRIALDAKGGFKWDARRPPFPGLLAFQEENAAIYFGRDDDIRRRRDSTLENAVGRKLRLAKFKHLSIDDLFFDSLKAGYDEFAKWFAGKTEEELYVVDDDTELSGMIYPKMENGPRQ